MILKYKLTNFLIIFLIASYSNVHADTKYQSQDYLHLLDFLKSYNVDKDAPAFYTKLKDEGLVIRPRIIELIRRVEIDQSAFGILNNQDLPVLLHSQIDKKLVDSEQKNNGLVSLRIIISHGNQITRMLYFNNVSNTHEMHLTEWTRKFPIGMVDFQIPKDWEKPMEFEKKWNADDFSWVNSILADPMPPVDYAAEIQGDVTQAYIFEAIIVDEGTANYKWAIRSSHHTSGFRQTFLPVAMKFLENINESIDIK